MKFLTSFWAFIKDLNHLPLLLAFLAILTIFFKIFQWIIKMSLQYRFSRKLNRVLKNMNEERDKSDFMNGNLNYILKSNFPQISMKLKNKIIKELEDMKEIEIGPFGEYVFYKGKIPNKNWRHFNPYR